MWKWSIERFKSWTEYNKFELETRGKFSFKKKEIKDSFMLI